MTPLFLRNFNCLTKTELILKLWEIISSSKINFSKSQTLWAWVYEKRNDKQKQMAWSKFSIKIVGVHFGNEELRIQQKQFNKQNKYLERIQVSLRR